VPTQADVKVGKNLKDLLLSGEALERKKREGTLPLQITSKRSGLLPHKQSKLFVEFEKTENFGGVRVLMLCKMGRKSGGI